MNESKSNREILKDQVVELVKEFIKTEGGITADDLKKLFGHHSVVQMALGQVQINFVN
jgi:hypothetical protein